MKKNEKGSLAITLIFITVLVTMGLALSARAIFNLEATTATENDTKAFYLAEAGIERFINEINSTEENEDISIDMENDLGDGSYSVTISDSDGDELIDDIEQGEFIDNIRDYTITSTGEISGVSKDVIIGFGLNSKNGAIASSDFNREWTGGDNDDNITPVPDDIHNERDDIPGFPGEFEDVDYLEDVLDDEYSDPDAEIYEFDSDHTPADAADNGILDLADIHDSRYFFADNDGFDLSGVNEIKGDPNEPAIIFSRHNFIANDDIHLENVYIFAVAVDQVNFGGNVTAENVLIHSSSNIQIEGNHFDYEGYMAAPDSYVEFGLSDGENSQFRQPESLDLPGYLDMFHNGSMQDYKEKVHSNDESNGFSRFAISSYKTN